MGGGGFLTKSKHSLQRTKALAGPGTSLRPGLRVAQGRKSFYIPTWLVILGKGTPGTIRGGEVTYWVSLGHPAGTQQQEERLIWCPASWSYLAPVCIWPSLCC